MLEVPSESGGYFGQIGCWLTVVAIEALGDCYLAAATIRSYLKLQGVDGGRRLEY